MENFEISVDSITKAKAFQFLKLSNGTLSIIISLTFLGLQKSMLFQSKPTKWCLGFNPPYLQGVWEYLIYNKVASCWPAASTFTMSKFMYTCFPLSLRSNYSSEPFWTFKYKFQDIIIIFLNAFKTMFIYGKRGRYIIL